jgi:hypothetical protein
MGVNKRCAVVQQRKREREIERELLKQCGRFDMVKSKATASLEDDELRKAKTSDKVSRRQMH